MLHPMVRHRTDIDLYVDGACSGNPGPGSAHWVVYIDGKQYTGSHSFANELVTNNYCELGAIAYGLSAVKKGMEKLNRPLKSVTVYLKSDSKVALSWIGKAPGPKSKVANKDDILMMRRYIIEIIDVFYTVSFSQIPRDENVADPGNK